MNRRIIGRAWWSACCVGLTMVTAGIGGRWECASAGEGDAAATAGGRNRRVVAVTSLSDSGPGSLRAALDGGQRTIEFRVGGTIALRSPLVIRNPQITFAGETAPKPGITVTSKPFVIADTDEIIVRHLRFRNSDDDNLRISGGCRNILIEHCSSTRAGDGALDVSEDYKTHARPRDVTVAYCLFAGTDKATLLATCERIRLHHNVWTHNGQRNPQIQNVAEFDLRYNVMRSWSVYGTRIRGGSTGNVVGNVFGPSSKKSKRASLALIVADDAGESASRVHISGNSGPDGFDPNSLSNARQPFAGRKLQPAPLADVAKTVLTQAGAQPADDIDIAYLRGTADTTPRPAATK